MFPFFTTLNDSRTAPFSRVLSSRLFLLIVMSLMLVIVAGCDAGAFQGFATPAPVAAPNEMVDSVSAYRFPVPTPTPEPADDVFVRVNTVGARANLRSAPTLESTIVGKGNPGEVFQVVGQSEDGEWWQVCCLPAEDEQEAEASVPAWVAASVVTADGVDGAEFTSVTEPIIDGELSANWEVDWKCGSERCAVQECLATVTAASDGESAQQWLSVQHEVVWEDTCFPGDSWVFEIDRFTGQERTGEFVDNFLYSYWLGREPGDTNGVYPVTDDEGVAVWCSGPHNVEIEEGDGWTTIYEGTTCHDVRTGLLVTLSYTKRWLFTGEYDGQTYERAYFGDSETLEQRLVETDLPLFRVDKR